MARISPAELWDVIVETGLCAGPTAAALRAELEAAPSAPGGDARDVAAWFVERGVLTRWQARRVAVGDRGPFFCGDYRLLERHDHDGEAFEFTARHEPSGRAVTVVLMAKRAWRDPDVRAAIVRRATIAAGAADPLLVRFWALEEDDGRPFAVCEEVRGATLAEELGRRGAVPLREAGTIVLDAARAVAELHAAGEVHGGLSLDAFVRDSAGAGGWRLRQFPLATDPHLVPPRALVADDGELVCLGRRAAFVAPELATGAPCDPRSDVYALGCLLHALVTGTAPHWRGDARETLERAVAASPGPLDPAVVPAPLATLVGYMTSPDPRDRYPDAAEAARAIATTFGFPQPPLVEPAVAPAATVEPFGVTAARASGAVPRPGDPQAARQTAAEAARRRGRRLRLVGGALAGVILAAAAAVVALQTMPARRAVAVRPAPQRPAVRPAPAAPVERDPSPARAQEPVAAAGSADRDEAGTKAGDEAVPPEAAAVAGRIGPTLVDDASLPWASPTAGPPPVLAYLPAGSQLVVVARPSALLGEDEGRLLVRALGPAVESALGGVAAVCGCRPEQIETLAAGWQVDQLGGTVVGWTARLAEGAALPADEAFRTRSWGVAAGAGTQGEVIHKGAALSFWAPAKAAGRVLVAAPAQPLADIVSLAASADPPPLSLPLDLEVLAGVLDGSRHLTVLGSPYYLLNAGRSLFAGSLEPLAGQVEALLGESAQAAALSVHCGADFYMELDAVAALDVPPAAYAGQLAERIRAYPAAVKTSIAARDLHPYGRALVMDLPAMVRALAANVRSGPEGKVAVVNAYLPRHAGHNIALAAELALAQGGATSPASLAPATPGPAAPQDAIGRLAEKMTLVFAKDTLEKSIQMISDEIGVPMEIVGPDLQLEGITKNQSFGLDESDKPAGEILRVILAKANPDGKLVYVVRKQDGVESIEITTRAAAAKRGDVLPDRYQDVGEPPKKGAK